MTPPTSYLCPVVRIHDGDSVTVDCTVAADFGAAVRLGELHLRLAHINAPELRTLEGKRSWARLVELVAEAVLVEPLRDGHGAGRREKYGRWLAVLRKPGAAPEEPSINDQMLAE